MITHNYRAAQPHATHEHFKFREAGSHAKMIAAALFWVVLLTVIGAGAYLITLAA